MPPIRATMVPGRVPRSSGASRSTRYTPAFTMVLECRSADTGVGATIAPSSQEEKGIWADLVMPAKARSATGRSAAAGQRRPVRPGEQRVHLHDAAVCMKNEDGARERQAAEHVQGQGKEGLAARLLCAVVPDEEEGTERGDLPEQQDQRQAVGKKHAEHRAQKNELYEEEERPPVAIFPVMRVVCLHVPEAVDGDEAAHHSDDHAHDEGKLVGGESVFRRDAASVQDLRCDGKPGLEESQERDEVAGADDPQHEDEPCNSELKAEDGNIQILRWKRQLQGGKGKLPEYEENGACRNHHRGE